MIKTLFLLFIGYIIYKAIRVFQFITGNSKKYQNAYTNKSEENSFRPKEKKARKSYKIKNEDIIEAEFVELDPEETSRKEAS